MIRTPRNDSVSHFSSLLNSISGTSVFRCLWNSSSLDFSSIANLSSTHLTRRWGQMVSKTLGSKCLMAATRSWVFSYRAGLLILINTEFSRTDVVFRDFKGINLIQILAPQVRSEIRHGTWINHQKPYPCLLAKYLSYTTHFAVHVFLSSTLLSL